MAQTLKDPNGVPGGPEFGQIRSYLDQHKPNGMSAGEWSQAIEAIIGTNPQNRTRSQITALLIAWFNSFISGG